MTAEYQPIDAVLSQATAIRTAYADRYHATENPATQVLIESHLEPLDHALLMLEEVRDILTAEQEWSVIDDEH